MKTREAHRKREEWLEKLWTAAGLQVLQGRQVRCDQKTKEWLPPILGDERLEREFAKAGDDMCYTSSLLRIKLLQWKRGEPKLAEWQVYKALRSAIQKRGYAPVPWEKQRADKRQAPSPEEETAFAEAKSRWDNFAAMLKEKSLGEEFHRPCYYDAYHLKLWNPERPTELSANRLVSAPQHATGHLSGEGGPGRSPCLGRASGQPTAAVESGVCEDNGSAPAGSA
jgi:CRISPR-associated endonuclease Csn1